MITCMKYPRSEQERNTSSDQEDIV